MAKILVVGVYLANRPNTAVHLMYELQSSVAHTVVQRWAAIAPGQRGRFDLPWTKMVLTERTPKFTILNQLANDALDFDWLLLCDDDVEVSEGFLDWFIELAGKYDFAVAQPARTADSFIDHPIVQVMPGLKARRTRFVEIGPVVCLRRDAIPLLLPFPEDCGMGWGLDLVWPVRLERAGLRLGIVDAAPVAHRLRPPTAAYDGGEASQNMCWTLARHAHLGLDEAFTILDAYA
ncbi:glycosyltransferase family 2 protein [Thiomonas sp. FB-Cd]|uniref:glycosyltransferase family 2 protein n=1 Tax=Thiomonas sp. FB-Cd TaxID=1158292 RepID=UPI0004DF5658|nr:hypothetical protein [Thiomonas sp. FB-Cd]